ncbi:Hypothetical protein I595_2175 [Croceitalea dokdonensis DOKDO 023]|uniref:Transmembrane protein n=1 Tax=Croceitalea dokdonensis DOKDO 023 TaxID=1300341 RepID=A0A0P7A578_9FLAO|nr:DUF6122 family protein [Croceitalea dokdonensis]KPM31680.1 Hypothetical protein I595_2175 [Croceitalea dokdonensis DOKDO 023]
MFRFLVHYGIHFVVPFAIAYIMYREKWKLVCLILLAGICIDLDHLWASPIFDDERCSINFHLLHTYPFIMLYVLLFLLKKTRIVGLALLLHILADTVDCLLLRL